MLGDDVTLEELLVAGPMAPIRNPYPLYAQLRRETPVVQLPRTQGPLADDSAPPAYMLTRYDDVRSALRDDVRFSNAIVQRTMGVVMGPTIVGMDGPEHLKHRALITPALAPRALRGDFPGVVDSIAHRIIDSFAKKGSADLRADFTFSYPLTVFVEILGLPPEDVGDFHDWGIDLTLVAHDPQKGIAASQKMLEYLAPIVEQKRANPGSDLISKLATAEVDGQRLSDLEVVSFLRLLVLAGAETTYHLMGSGLFAMLSDADLLERVSAERDLIPALLDETLRWESPIGTVLRETTGDTEVGGVEIPAGATVLCHVGSANRDERRFPDPDRFDIDRADKEHIAFGFGKHYCAGSRLALLEAEVGLNAILDRLPNLRMQPGADSGVIGFSFRGPDCLPVEFDRATG
jgi:cytochrome P450